MGEDGSFDAKRRIVGAAILVTVAVVVLPILLQRPPSAVHGREILTVRRATHGVRAVMADIPARPTRPAPIASSIAPAPVADAQAPRSVPSRRTPVLPAPPTRPPPAPVVQQWYVQVGAYVNAADGIMFAHRLKGQGFPAHVKLTRLAKSRGVIVILGPYGKRRAQGAQQAVKERDGIQGFVIQEATAAR
ncbi:hypothetical protein C4901_12790 [Acidiferrobacter sp. SPIII_3]|uniref:SPOR domain-containing protein n=1 Tax=Acidiferrobacter sp. SPIII_3 TaxID=1281578 RepID=UPI000D733637|nr:SPOR domain-containing protein [Acidiferrobacter sp. SPIII_3]AWP24090.1 hypothetical protein C4901_12790 [Acidiferrobacter sp. SPIII_3]